MQRTMFEDIRQNKLRSWLIMVLFFILILIMGGGFGLVWGSLYFGLILAAVIGILYTLVMWHSGDRMILNMTGARAVTKQEYPHLYHAVEGLSVAAGLKSVPKCYVIKDSALNAFATGRDPEHSQLQLQPGC